MIGDDETDDSTVSDEGDVPTEDDISTSEPQTSEAEPNEKTDAEGSDEKEAGFDSVTDVETIVLDPDDVVQAVAYNGQEDIGRKGKAVFGLTPPFGETVEPTIRHLEDDSTEGKAEDEVHIRPFRFVAEGSQVVEQRPTRQLAKAELDTDDPSEAAIEAWIDEAMKTWKAHVRKNLVGSVDIYATGGMAFVGVEYREED